MELKERILDAAIDAFNDKGAKFILEDISKSLNISKKTIYTVFEDKESLLKGLIEYGFDSIKENEKRIYEDKALSTTEKIRQIIIVLPERFKQIDYRQFFTVKDRYPKLYKVIQLRIETGWEATIELLEQGMTEGCIRKVSIPVLKAMIEASIEHFLDSESLQKEGNSYTENLEIMMDILMHGMMTNEKG